MLKLKPIGLLAVLGLVWTGCHCQAPPNPTPGPNPSPPQDGQTFECSGETTPVSGKWGYLSIKRDTQACGFRPEGKDTAFFAIGTSSLRLKDSEYIKLVSAAAAETEKKIAGPIGADFLLIGMKQPEIAFYFKDLDQSTMLLEFRQIDPIIPINGDHSNSLILQSIDLAKFSLNITKAIEQPLHLQVFGTAAPFGHSLIEKSEALVAIVSKQSNTDQRVFVDVSPVSGQCSKSYKDTDEASHELAGPQDLTKVGPSYKCVNIFELTSAANQAHYDVSFANFLDITDQYDELALDDGVQSLKIVKFSAKYYYQRKPEISFKGKNLMVSYSNPQAESKVFMSKLTVKSRTSGGVIDSFGKLALPTKGKTRYALRPATDGTATSLIIANLKGTGLKIFGGQNRFINLTEGMFLPPEIGLHDSQDDTILELSAKSQPSGSIEFAKSLTQCSGILFEPEGIIALEGTKKVCYWLLNDRATLNDLSLPDSCLEIYPLNQKDPVFSKCNSTPVEVLPRFVVGPAYLKITLGGRFKATVSPPSIGLVASSNKNLTIINSAGYPSYYAWSDATESFQVNATNKSIVLTVKDLNLRDGEKIFLDATEILASKSDFDISNKTVTLKVQRSSGTKDYQVRRGVSMYAMQFDRIMVDIKTSPVKTPKSLSNILLRVPAPAKTRFSFNISEIDKGALIRVFDSQSLMGRKIAEEEMIRTASSLSGSTTTNTLLVWVNSTETTVSFQQIPCNQTSDHVCDGGSRCVPLDKMCKGRSYCEDGSDLKISCSSPPPKIVQRGISGATVFFLSVLMFSLGVLATLYGPDFYKNLNTRFRSGQYTTFSSTE